MRYIISENNIRNLVYKYLDSSPLFEGVEEHRTGYPAAVKEYFQEVHSGEDIDPDYDHVFTYYRDPESYEDIVGVESPYSPDYYPLIELDTYYIYEPLEGLFGENIVKQYVKEWINEKFNLNATHLEPN
jgi:hypothetical protein